MSCVLVAHSARQYVGALGARRQAVAIVLYTELAGSDPPEVAPSKLLGSYFSSRSAPASFWGAYSGDMSGELFWGTSLGSFLGTLWD